MSSRTLSISLVVCLLAGVAMAQPAPPTLDDADFVSLVYAAGGDSVANNTGAFVKLAVWLANSPSDFVDGDGDAPFTASVTLIDSGGDVLSLQASGTPFSGAITGTGSYVDFADDDTADGWYYVTIDDSNQVTLDNANVFSDFSAPQIATIRIGGAIDSLANMAAKDIADATNVNCDVFVRENEVATASAVFSGGGGTTTTVLTVWGVDSSWVKNPAVDRDGTVDATASRLTTTTSLVNGLIQITDNFIDIRGIEMDCDGDGANNAEHAILGGANTESVRIIDCILKEADTSGAEVGGSADHFSFINCKIFGNGQDGAGLGGGIERSSASRGSVAAYGCEIHDNDGAGIEIGSDNAIIEYCQIFDNTGDGIDGNENANAITVANNTIYGNDEHGVTLGAAGLIRIVVFNNTLVANGVDAGGPWYGLNLAGTPAQQVQFLGNNHSENNFDGHSDQAITDAAWIAFYHGGNIVGDGAGGTDETKIFTNVGDGTEDFTPPVGSPLINAGVHNTHIGAVMPANGAGGVAGFGNKSGGKQ